MNKGRLGAKEGPDAIKKAFANLPVLSDCKIYDYGNVEHDHDDLEDTQKNSQNMLRHQYKGINRRFIGWWT